MMISFPDTSAVAHWTVAFLGRNRRQRTITEQQVFARTRAGLSQVAYQYGRECPR
jgi:hypothetical protein